MIEQHLLGDNTVLATFGVVPSAEGITIIGSTLWYTSYRQRLLAAVDLRTGKRGSGIGSQVIPQACVGTVRSCGTVITCTVSSARYISQSLRTQQYPSREPKRRDDACHVFC